MYQLILSVLILFFSSILFASDLVDDKLLQNIEELSETSSILDSDSSEKAISSNLSNSLDFKSLTPQQKAGQLLLFGIHETEMTPELKSFVNQTHVGGFVFFKRNIKDLSTFRGLIESLKGSNDLNRNLTPLFAIDEEGGSVSRLPFDPKVPSAALLGSSKQPELAKKVGEEIGSSMADLGLNMNLAPVLDLGGPKNFLKTRAYSSSAQVVSQFGLEFSLGLTSAGVLPCGKHFPGMGNSTSDPHFHVAKARFEKRQDFRRTVFPFQKYAESVPQGTLMMSHLIYPQLDPKLPAVYSPKIYEYARKRLRFDGLIITDDLQMAGIKDANEKSLKENVFKALMAGADLVMVTWSRKTQIEVHAYLTKKIKEGKFPAEKLNEKLARIQRAKEWVTTNQKTPPVPRGLASEKDRSSMEDSPIDSNTLFDKRIPSQGISEVWQELRRRSRR